MSSKSQVIACLLASCAALASPLTESLESYRLRQERATPASVLERLKAGNLRFAQGQSDHGGYPKDSSERRANAAQGQRPLAAVLSCIDSRTTPELVFDQSVGDLFTARVGANVVNDDILGSLEIAAESGIHIIVILGHTDCGGVKGACAGLELGHMTQLLERVKLSIAKANQLLDQDPTLSAAIGERTVTNRRYIAHASHTHAKESARQILERSPLLRDKVSKGELLLISALYDVDTGLVTFDTPERFM